MTIVPGVGKTGTTAYLGRVKLATAYYSFATDGGAIGAITLRGDSIPSGAILTDVILNVSTAVTSGGAATVAIAIEGAADTRAADVLATAPALSTTGAKRSALINTADLTPLKTTAVRSIVATVGA